MNEILPNDLLFKYNEFKHIFIISPIFSLIYVCKTCGLSVWYFKKLSDIIYMRRNYTFGAYDTNLNITCDEYIIKNIIE